MNNFLRRLKIYGLGFGIGMVFVFFFFRNRGCTWLPENRVKNTILGRVLVVSAMQSPFLEQHNLTKKDLIHFLDDGDVDFGGSKKEGNPQVYAVTKTVRGKEVTLWFTLPKNSFVSEVIWPKGNIQKATNTTQGMGDLIHFPNVKTIVYLDNNPEFVAQRTKLKLKEPKTVFQRLKKTGKIDFSKSYLKLDELPEHYVLFSTKTGERLAAKTTWYQEHIQFYSFLPSDSI